GPTTATRVARSIRSASVGTLGPSGKALPLMLVGLPAATSSIPYAIMAGVLWWRRKNSTCRGSLTSTLTRSNPPVIWRKLNELRMVKSTWYVRRNAATRVEPGAERVSRRRVWYCRLTEQRRWRQAERDDECQGAK